MNAAALDNDLHITTEQKRAALDAALKSNTFARADQLKSFLRYVCEMEIEGRGGELTEYLIGVEALGRPSKYSPGDDSAVRNRAFALRKKLQEYYEHENPDAPIRIELHKGSYCPHFVENLPSEKSNGNGVSIYQSAVVPMTPAPLVPYRGPTMFRRRARPRPAMRRKDRCGALWPESLSRLSSPGRSTC